MRWDFQHAKWAGLAPLIFLMSCTYQPVSADSICGVYLGAPEQGAKGVSSDCEFGDDVGVQYRTCRGVLSKIIVGQDFSSSPGLTHSGGYGLPATKSRTPWESAHEWADNAVALMESEGWSQVPSLHQERHEDTVIKATSGNSLMKTVFVLQRAGVFREVVVTESNMGLAKVGGAIVGTDPPVRGSGKLDFCGSKGEYSSRR